MAETKLSGNQVEGIQNSANNEPLQIWEGSIEDYNNELDSPSCWYGYKANNITNYLTPYNVAIDIDQTKGFLVSYGDGKFISAGIMNNRSSSDNVINYSYDGINWKSYYLENSYKWDCITYGGPGFVIIDRTNKTAFSEDGIDWTFSTIPSENSTYQWHNVIWDGSNYVAIRGNKEVATSSDGINWSMSTSTPEYGYCIAYGSGKYVISGSGTNGRGKIMYSSDLSSWTLTSQITGVSDWQSGHHTLAYGNNKFISLTSSSNAIATSSDGITWTKETPSNFYSGVGSAILFVDDMFICINNRYGYLCYSSDGITWTNKNITKDVTSNWQSFTYGEGRLLYTPLVGNGECGYRDIFKRLYTLEQNPSEGDNVYTKINGQKSIYNITSVSGSTITVNGESYTYESNLDAYEPLNIGSLNPNYICLIRNGNLNENLGEIRIGNRIIASDIPNTNNPQNGKILTLIGDKQEWRELIPSFAFDSNKFLKNNGTSLVWDNPLPYAYMSDNGKVLTNNDGTPTWLSAFPDQTGNVGKVLKSDGSNPYWGTTDSIPSVTGNADKFLFNDGSVASWESETYTAPKVEKHKIASSTSTVILDNDLSDTCTIHVYKNGIRQVERIESSDTIYDFYKTTSGTTTTLNFANSLASNDVILVDLLYNKISVQRQPSTVIELSGDFNTHTSYLTHLTGGSYPFVIDTVNDRLYSGSTSYHTNNGCSWGYLSFTTPNFSTPLHVEAYASSENNYDWGAVLLSLDSTASLSGVAPNENGYANKIKNANISPSGTVPTAGNPILIMRSSGPNTSYATLDYTLAASTTYYVHFIYAKDGSSDANDDRFYISKIRFTVPV